MHNSINTILLATDFTEKSQNALSLALEVASRHHSRLIIMHNIDHFFVIDKTGRQLLGADIVKDNVQRAEHTLENLRISLAAAHPKLFIETVLKTDSLTGAINGVVEDEDVDLVICGSSGSQNFLQVIIGSRSYEILMGSHASVMLVPESCTKYSFERILVPVRVLVDLADKIDLAVAIAEKNKGIINLLGLAEEGNVDLMKTAYQDMKSMLETAAQQYQSQFMPGGDSALRISDYSREDETDLIILSFQDEKSWKSFFLENFFKQIINNTDIPLFFLKNKYRKKESEAKATSGYDILLPHPG